MARVSASIWRTRTSGETMGGAVDVGVEDADARAHAVERVREVDGDRGLADATLHARLERQGAIPTPYKDLSKERGGREGGREGGEVLEPVVVVVVKLPIKLSAVLSLCTAHHSRLRRARLALQTFEWIRRQPWYRPDTRWYAKVIGIAGRAREVDLAWSFLLQMQAEGCQPDTAVCNALLKALAAAGRIGKAVDLLRRMQCSEACRPDVVTFNTAIDAVGAAGMLAEAEGLLQEMRDQGLVPDVYTYCSVIKAYGRVPNTARMEAVVEEMARAGCMANQLVHNAVIRGYAQAHDLSGMMRSLQRMLDAGLNPDAWTYNSLLEAYGRAGQEEPMEAALQAMVERRIALSAHTYSILIRGYGLCGSPAKAERVFQDSRDAALADAHVYTSMIEALASAGELDRAQECLDEMAGGRGASSSSLLAAYGSLVKAHARAGALEKMQKLLADMAAQGIPKDAAMCQELLAAWERAGQADRAAEVLAEMRRMGFRVRRTGSRIPPTRGTLLHDIYAAQLSEAGEKLESIMETGLQAKVVPPGVDPRIRHAWQAPVCAVHGLTKRDLLLGRLEENTKVAFRARCVIDSRRMADDLSTPRSVCTYGYAPSDSSSAATALSDRGPEPHVPSLPDPEMRMVGL
eukprot:SM000158S02024  [mRNA]  locus=s158:158148:161462:- [translate_table: standard]